MKNRVVKKMVEISESEKSVKERLLFLIPQAILFLLILPVVLFVIPQFTLDKWLGLDTFKLIIWIRLLLVLIVIIGLITAMWSIIVQFKLGKGTPMPLMATQKLVIRKPFSLCRNPMAFGTILMYFGISLLTSSISAVIMFVLFTALLLSYIKFIEEKELEIRFGQAYIEYKKITPFIFPRNIFK